MILSTRGNTYGQNLVRRDGEPVRHFALDAGGNRRDGIRMRPHAGVANAGTGHGA
ncbi:MAG: hypothetical protein WCA64_12300 [Gallionella sp.]